jgi:hypothetical protein
MNLHAEIETAQIERTLIGFEDHGIFAVSLSFKGSGWGQGTGCYALGEMDSLDRFVRGVLGALQVRQWEDLPNTFVRIRRVSDRIVGVGHLMEERWFNITEWSEKRSEAQEAA